MKRHLVLMTCLAAAIGVMLGMNPNVAGAHGDDGDMTVVTSEQDGPNKIRLLVGILYSNDTDPAAEATVSVTGTGPDGATLAETQLPKEEGAKYGATVEVPDSGTWQLTITSTDPVATAIATVEVTAQPTTTEAAPTTTTAQVVPTTDTAATPTTQPTAVSDTDDSGSNTGMFILIGALVVVVLGGAALILRARKAPPSE